MDTSESSQKLVNFSKPTPDFSRKFYDLFCQKTMVDVTLSADGQFVSAHKVVLAVASSWFEELFDLLKDKHPVIVLKDVSLQQLNSIIEFIYLGSVAVAEEDVAVFKASLEALRISIDEIAQAEEAAEVNKEQEAEEEGSDEEEARGGGEEEEEEEEMEDVEVEEAETEEPLKEEKAEEEEEKAEEEEVKIKKEPEWDDDVIKEEPLDRKEALTSSLKVSKVVHLAPVQQRSAVPSPGVIRIRTPASINERARVASNVPQPNRIVKIVQKMPPAASTSANTLPTQTPDKMNVQELSKRLSKAILIRRVKKSDGSVISERSPVQIIKGVKIQKAGQNTAVNFQRPVQTQQQLFSAVRAPHSMLQQRKIVMIPSERRQMPVFRCSHCSKAFSVNKRRNAHEKYCFKNPSRPSSQCPYCPMVLCNPMYIQTHIKKVHGIDDNGQLLNETV